MAKTNAKVFRPVLEAQPQLIIAYTCLRLQPNLARYFGEEDALGEQGWGGVERLGAGGREGGGGEGEEVRTSPVLPGWPSPSAGAAAPGAGAGPGAAVPSTAGIVEPPAVGVPPSCAGVDAALLPAGVTISRGLSTITSSGTWTLTRSGASPRRTTGAAGEGVAAAAGAPTVGAGDEAVAPDEEDVEASAEAAGGDSPG